MARPCSSCIAPQVEAFLRHRRAAGAVCSAAEKSLRLLDAHVLAEFPGATALTQEMVDSWCERRPGESANTCGARGRPVVAFVRFLRERGETDVVEPELPRAQESGFAPHAFTDDELAALFAEADAWEPRRNTAGHDAYVRTKRTLPVIFRLLWSSGIRTTEARLLRRECVDLSLGVLHIREGKGRSERLVALHESMRPMMRDHDGAMEALWPDRAYFFPNGPEGHVSATLLSLWFRTLWSRVSDEPARAYDLRHDFCRRCMDQLAGGGLDGMRDLEWVSKAMGHTSVDVTVRFYYHLTPSVAALLQERCAEGDEKTIPEVARR